jgi:hypothetical protein
MINPTKLSALLKEAEEAHARYEQTTLNGVRDANWQDWYAGYMAEAMNTNPASVEAA